MSQQRIRLTIDIINTRVSTRGVVCVDFAGNARSKSLFKCQYGHSWIATADSVCRGSGCPHCAGQTKITLDLANQKLKPRGITCVNFTSGARSNCTFMCDKGHAWVTSMSKVLNNSGCPHCSNKARLTIQTINIRLKERGLLCTLSPGSVSQKGSFRCKNGHTWDAIVNNVLTHGRGCPFCSVSGFKPDEKACVYVLSDSLTSPTVIKIGVANDADKRITILKSKTPFPVYEILRFDFEAGKDAYSFEQYCHYCLAVFNAGLTGFDGCTEWFLYNNNLLDWIKNESKTLSNRCDK